MSKLKALAGETLIYGVSTILVRAFNWLLGPLLTYVLLASEFGTMSELYAYVAFINVLFMYGLETAFFRFATKDVTHASKVFSTSFYSLLFTTILFGGGVLYFAPQLSEMLLENVKTEYIQIFILIICLDTLSNIPFAKLRLEKKPLKFVSIKFLNVVVNLAVNFFLLFPIYMDDYSMFGYTVNPDMKLTYVFIANLSASAVTLLYFLPSILRSKFEFCLATWKTMMSYSWPFIIVGLAGMVNETVDRILLKWLLPQNSLEERMAQIGIYSAAYKLSIFMNLAVQGFKMGVEPFFFRNSKEKDARIMYAEIMNYFVIAALLIFLGVSLNVDWIIQLLDKNFTAGKGVVPIVLMAYLFLGIFYNLSVWYKLTDKTLLAIPITLFGALITVIVNFLLIPKIGYLGSAWATFLAYFSMTVISYFWGRKHYEVHYNISKIVAYIVIAVLLYIGSSLVHFNNELLQFFFNNLLLIGFVVVVYFFDLRKLMQK